MHLYEKIHQDGTTVSTSKHRKVGKMRNCLGACDEEGQKRIKKKSQRKIICK